MIDLDNLAQGRRSSPGELDPPVPQALIRERGLDPGHAGIPVEPVVQTCPAMGWPDPRLPANAGGAQRKSVDDAAGCLGLANGGRSRGGDEAGH